MHIKPKYNCLRCNPNSFVKSNHIFVISKKNPLSHAYVCVRLLCIFFIWSFVIAPNQFEGAMNMNMHHAAIWIFLSIVFLKQTIFFLVSVRCSSNAHRFCSAKIYLYFIIFHLNGIFHLIFLRLHKRLWQKSIQSLFCWCCCCCSESKGGWERFIFRNWAFWMRFRCYVCISNV